MFGKGKEFKAIVDDFERRLHLATRKDIDRDTYLQLQSMKRCIEGLLEVGPMGYNEWQEKSIKDFPFGRSEKNLLKMRFKTLGDFFTYLYEDGVHTLTNFPNLGCIKAYRIFCVLLNYDNIPKHVILAFQEYLL